MLRKCFTGTKHVFRFRQGETEMNQMDPLGQKLFLYNSFETVTDGNNPCCQCRAAQHSKCGLTHQRRLMKKCFGYDIGSSCLCRESPTDVVLKNKSPSA